MCVRSALWHCHEKQGDGQSESLPSMGGRARSFVLIPISYEDEHNSDPRKLVIPKLQCVEDLFSFIIVWYRLLGQSYIPPLQ